MSDNECQVCQKDSSKSERKGCYLPSMVNSLENELLTKNTGGHAEACRVEDVKIFIGYDTHLKLLQ